ncbi:amidohydrolase family protein [Blastomonas fulva]|jgi:5-carboxyvanillate decarboxylase|uniref:amidohydrolase family protein n=1 Tax=Blastomonas fulva TaxID=1550728 RepID=UPI0025A42E65|nr:amidohydrolase family protein [Blastomonas fulva]MDM7928749.1 amidohydrolase family protein [Blastomonas fulva]MDM7964535.1 amidohydrolase family protein [Blastomonas fulva]
MNAPQTGGAQGYLRIATEEAFSTPELIAAFRDELAAPDVDPGFQSLIGFYLDHPAERPQFIANALVDLGEQRIADMDIRGIDRQVLALTAPATNALRDPDRAVMVAQTANDRLADACRKYPDRFSGMAACAVQVPDVAAREIERCVTKLGFTAVVINSHILGEYLDNPKFSAVLEAAEALDVPIYIHPNTPPANMIGPMLESGLDGALFGFGVETGMHALRVITSGVLDRFPKLQIILGHMGEALPYWLYRLDFMHQAGVRAGRYECMKPLKKGKVSNYLRENFHFTNSGMAWEPAIKFAQQVIGEDRVLYAMDYPYQCPVEEVSYLDAMDMPIETKRKFFQTNAEKLFKLV